MWEKSFDFLVDTLIAVFLPLVHLYYGVTGDLLLNVAADDARGLEKAANQLLVPYQYVFSGRSATWNEEKGIYEFSARFPVDRWFWPKMGASLTALPVSFVLGGACKAASFLSSETQNRYARLKNRYQPEKIDLKAGLYASLGLPSHHPQDEALFPSQGHKRNPKDLLYMQEEKEAFQAIAEALNRANIAWWVDCGTLLGTYRYGGVIPWDCDIDIALLLPDFDNVVSALSSLDPSLYTVQDWSGRSRPKSYLKVACHKKAAVLDLYFFDILPETQEVKYILSLEGHTFFPEWWHIRESRFTVPTPFSVVFPLKKAMFDGIEVFIPQDPEKYLQMRYGENLAPAKVYNPETGLYEKDLSHPYWQRAYVK